jgi:hypothetical protein
MVEVGRFWANGGSWQVRFLRNPNEILRVKLSKLGFHFQNFIPYKSGLTA